MGLGDVATSLPLEVGEVTRVRVRGREKVRWFVTEHDLIIVNGAVASVFSTAAARSLCVCVCVCLSVCVCVCLRVCLCDLIVVNGAVGDAALQASPYRNPLI